MTPERRRQGDDLTGRRQGYNELEQRLERFFARALLAFAAIGITSAVALGGFTYLLNEIQDQRYIWIKERCQDQNQRHENTSTQLIIAAEEDIRRAPTEAKKNEIRRRRDVTLGLIEALAPHKNCEQEAQDAVEGGD